MIDSSRLMSGHRKPLSKIGFVFSTAEPAENAEKASITKTYFSINPTNSTPSADPAF